MRGATCILLLAVGAMLSFHSCRNTEHSFVSRVVCSTNFADIQLLLTHEATGVTRELTVQENGSVRFEDLTEDAYILRTTVDPGILPYPTFESVHHFVPGSHSNDLLFIPEMPQVLEAQLIVTSSEVEVSGQFMENGCLYADSVYAYGSTEWPFELTAENLVYAERIDFQRNFRFPIPDSSYHVVYTYVTNRRGRRTISRSVPIGTSTVGLKYEYVQFGKRHVFDLRDGETFTFRADLKKGQLYLIEFWDQYNSNEFTGEELVVALKGILSDVRTRPIGGAAIPIYGWRDDPLMFTCTPAAFTSPGTYAFRITELTGLPVEDLETSDTVVFTSSSQVRLLRGSYSEGQHQLHYDRVESEAEGRVKFSLFQSADWKYVSTTEGWPVLNNGPAYPAEGTFNRNFQLVAPMDVCLVLVSSYNGDPGAVVVGMD